MPTFRPHLPTLLFTGIGLGLSFPPYPFPFLAWVALVPLLLRWDRATWMGGVLLESYLAFLLTFATAFYWPALHPVPSAAMASVSGLLLLPLWMALPLALSVPLRRRLGRGLGFAGLAGLFLLMEGALSRGPFAFPWVLLGHTQAEALRFVQFAAWTGVPGITLWVLLLNGMGLALIRRPRWRGRLGVLLALLIAGPFAASQWRLSHAPAPVGAVPIGLVQPALPPDVWADLGDASRVDTLLARTRPLLALPLLGDGAPTVRLVLWPETALPPLRDDTERAALYARLDAWTATHDIALLTGAITPAEGDTAGFFSNAALLFRPDGSRARYEKYRLVPFAEHVPLVERWPWLRRFSVDAGGIAGYRRGPVPEVLTLGETRLGVLICFESLFGNQARTYVEQGADLLVTLTQDGWWGRTPGYRQHLAFNRLRAIESGRALVQVSVTGVSALLLPSGASVFEAGWMEPTAARTLVPIFAARTWYARHGDVVTGLALLVVLFLIPLAFFRRPALV